MGPSEKGGREKSQRPLILDRLSRAALICDLSRGDRVAQTKASSGETIVVEDTTESPIGGIHVKRILIKIWYPRSALESAPNARFKREDRMTEKHTGNATRRNWNWIPLSGEKLRSFLTLRPTDNKVCRSPGHCFARARQRVAAPSDSLLSRATLLIINFGLLILIRLARCATRRNRMAWLRRDYNFNRSITALRERERIVSRLTPKRRRLRRRSSCMRT